MQQRTRAVAPEGWVASHVVTQPRRAVHHLCSAQRQRPLRQLLLGALLLQRRRPAGQRLHERAVGLQLPAARLQLQAAAVAAAVAATASSCRIEHALVRQLQRRLLLLRRRLPGFLLRCNMVCCSCWHADDFQEQLCRISSDAPDYVTLLAGGQARLRGGCCRCRRLVWWCRHMVAGERCSCPSSTCAGGNGSRFAAASASCDAASESTQLTGSASPHLPAVHAPAACGMTAAQAPPRRLLALPPGPMLHACQTCSCRGPLAARLLRMGPALQAGGRAGGRAASLAAATVCLAMHGGRAWSQEV